MDKREDRIILGDELANEIGSEEKPAPPREPKLHRAFSIFLYDDMKVVQLKGNMFDSTSAVIITDVSGHPFSESEYNIFDFYNGDKTLSAFGTVSGVSVPYEVINNETLLVQIPDYTPDAIIDVKVLGEFGMGSLMDDSKREYIKYAEGETDAPPPTVNGIKLLGDR